LENAEDMIFPLTLLSLYLQHRRYSRFSGLGIAKEEPLRGTAASTQYPENRVFTRYWVLDTY
jgi:hypothetical protein